MKKILFMFLMVMGLFSSALALETIKIGCDVEKSQWGEGADASPAIAPSQKVSVLHKDTLMPVVFASLRNDGHDETIVNKTVVRQLRGVAGA